MNVALDVIRSIYIGLFNFMFSAYLFDGVSLGMICVVVFIFAVLISALLNTPALNGKDRSDIKWHVKSK